MSSQCTLLRFFALVLFCLLCAPVVHADQIGFAGLYDPSLWTVVNPVGGSVDATGAPNVIVVTGANSGSAGDAGLYIQAPFSGTVTFDWSYVTNDWGPSYDPAGYIINATVYQLTDSGGPSTQSGWASFGVTAGDIFGFGVRTTDGIEGPGVLTIYNFTAPDGGDVPEPATWLLVGAALALIGFRRRKT